MKILNIIQRYPPAVGGSETWCQEVCRYLAKRKHRVQVLTLDVNKEEEFWREPSDRDHTIALGRLAWDQGVRIRRFKRSLPIHLLYHALFRKLIDERFKVYFYGPHSIEMYGKMWREVRQADVVVLHTMPYPHNFIALFWAKLLRKKIIMVPHFHPTHPHYERRVNYWLLHQCDGILTVSEYEKNYLVGKGISALSIYVTGNGIHPDLYKPDNVDAFKNKLTTDYRLLQGDKVIVFIGRKTKEKGVLTLIEAAKAVRKDIPIKLFLVGPGIDWYDRLYAELSAAEKKYIIDLGVLSHAEKVNLLHCSDILVLPSQYEAFGIVFLEAWVCGKPVIGTDQGAMPSVIGNDGYVCRFGDTADLIAKIKKAFAQPEDANQKGLSGRSKVLKNYTWDCIGKKVEQAIKTVYES
jgi:glycosyltransferase involved in cell wall biosynthesis